MGRNYTTLRVFVLADELVADVYSVSRTLPPDERFGLQSQLRRAALSVPTNIVEGSSRHSERVYLTFLETAAGSASEVRYLLGIGVRLGLLDSRALRLSGRYDELVRQLEALVAHIRRSEATTSRASPGKRTGLKAES